MVQRLLSRRQDTGSRTWLCVLLAVWLLTGAFCAIPVAHAAETVSTISGTVYLDSNGNGAIDAADTPFAGVAVTLVDANGATVLDINGLPVVPFVTNIRGRFSFFNVRTDQTYRIVETVPAGYGANLAVGPVANVVKESNTVLKISTPTPTGVPTTFDGNQFLLVAPVQIAGNVWIDNAGTHLLNPLDTRFSTPQVILQGDFNGDGISDTAQAVVDVTGHYNFSTWTNPANGQTQLILPGVYQVVQTVPDGYTAVDAFPGSGNDVKLTTTVLQVAATTPNTLYDNEDFLIGHPVVVGSLSGIAYCDLNGDKTYTAGEPLLSGVVLTLIKSDGTTATATTSTTGYYQFFSLPAGSYRVSAPVTTNGKTLVTSSTLTVAVVAAQDTPDNNFGYVGTNVSGSFTTFTQGGWGSTPHGSNPGALLANNFARVFGSAGVTIGGSHAYKFTSAQNVQNFLPQGGTPALLLSSATNPTARTNVFAGQVLALQLSISFSNAGVTRNGLSALTVVSGSLAGMSAAQVLALANTVLGGNTAALLPYGLSVSGLNDIVTSINQNYDNGTVDNHFLH